MAATTFTIPRTVAPGILQSSLSPKYLHTNSTSHTWPFSAIAELIDNAYDPDVKASQLWIDKVKIRGEICLTFTDNGSGMPPHKLHKMLSFGFCEKVADGNHMPVGHYGNGFKSGSMRLGRDALVLTKQEDTRSVGYLSQTYLELIKAETVVVPIASWDKNGDNFVIRPQGKEAFQDILKYSLLKSEEELSNQFDKIPGDHGTIIIISNVRKTTDNKPEFDFVTDEYDIRIPDDTNTESEKYRSTKRQNHIPECDYSLRAYCAILYLKPRMQIILRQKKVQTLVVEKSLSKTEVDRYKPQHAEAVKVVFGFNSRNKNHYGIMMYHRNRLIKPYERVGHQLKANNLGVGVVGVVQCDFLQPTHNKQDFDYTKPYRACMHALGIKLNEYWNEKKGPARSASINVLDPPIPLPQEIQSLPDQTWVQCDEPTCLKWRKLPDGMDPACLPEKWFCHMNPDPQYKSCDIPEEKDDEPITITPYAKVQKKRLNKEIEEKQRREKALRMAEQLAQEQRKKLLEKKEADLRKKEELLNKQMAQLQDITPKVKVEEGSSPSLPTAQVAPRTTTRFLKAVTPAAKPLPRQIGGQLAARLVQSSQSAGKASQINQSPQSKSKLTSSPSPILVARPPQKIALSSPRPLAPRTTHSGQSASTPSITNQSTVTRVTTNQSSPGSPLSPLKRNVTFAQSKVVQTPPRSFKIVTKSHPGLLQTGGVTFKVVKSANGGTFLVQETKSRDTTTSANSKSSGTNTVVKANNGTALPATSTSTGWLTASKKQTVPAGARSAASTLDVKPVLNVVLPKPQTSSLSLASVRATTETNNRIISRAIAAAKQPISVVSTSQSTPSTVAKTTIGSSTDVRPTHELAATAYSEITGDKGTTPQDVKIILASRIKREPAESLVCPVPNKVAKKKSDATVIVIDPLPSEEPQQEGQKNSEEKRIKELEKEMDALKKENQDKVEKLRVQLDEKVSQLNKKTKELEERKKEISSKDVELKGKKKELNELRGNVCQLLQVLVPEIDVECDGNGEAVDDLLKQVLEANR